MNHVQTIFFGMIRNRYRDPAEMVDEIADLLDISKDSVYRRIKGEKPIQYDEIRILSQHFRLPLDELLFHGSPAIVFTGQYIHEEHFRLQSMLEEMEDQLAQLASLEDPELTYVSKDIPVFYYLMFPEVTAFKFFVWLKSQFQFNEWKDRKFTFDILTETLQARSMRVAVLYHQLRSVEVLNADNILNDLRQLEYYWDTGIFTNAGDLDKVYTALHRMVDHMEEQAVVGRKSLPGDSQKGAPLQVYVNDFFVGDNTVLAGNEHLKRVFINHSAVNFMSTGDPDFVAYNTAFTQNLIRKSTLISEVGERTRSRFFHLIHERINRSRRQTLDIPDLSR